VDHTQKIMLGQLGASDAERLKTRLAREGIEIATVHNGATCNSGCSVSLEVWAHPDDLPEIDRLMRSDRAKMLGDLGADAALVDSVFDSSAEHATCPACGTQFETRHGECPECGLCFSVAP
jgi:hypothetical protein